MKPELLAWMAWPVVAVVAILVFRKPIERLIDRLGRIKVRTKDGHEIEITVKEAADITQQLLDETDRLIEDIDSADQEILRNVAKATNPLRVDALVEGFDRDRTDDLERLRKLRDRQLIRPQEGGRWQPDKHVEIKPFGRLLLKIREEKLLGERQAS